jgi:hypothetical protein
MDVQTNAFIRHWFCLWNREWQPIAAVGCGQPPAAVADASLKVERDCECTLQLCDQAQCDHTDDSDATACGRQYMVDFATWL